MIIWLTMLKGTMSNPKWYHRVSDDFLISMGLAGLLEFLVLECMIIGVPIARSLS